jgi:subtilisin family serine protease
VVCRSARPTWTPYTGTSLSTPLVTGAAALLIAHSPGSPMAEIRRRILETVDPLPSLAGKVASSGRLDVAAALSSHDADRDEGSSRPSV